MSDAFRFAVMGDCHFVGPKYVAAADRGEDYRRYHWMVENLWPRALAEIREAGPAFLVQLGDFADWSCGEARQPGGMREAMDTLANGSGCPVWLAKGNHEREAAFRDMAMPMLRERLLALQGGKGRPLTAPYYAFSHSDSRFIVVHDRDLRPGSPQVDWLEAELRGAQQSAAHTFLFSHAPLFTVGRPFFTHKPMLDVTLWLLDRWRVDAFFCGHTHNQAATLHRNVRNPLLQLKSALIGFPQSPLVPLHEARPSAISRDSYDYYWGFVEDCAPSWLLVTVDGQRVQVEWRLLGRGDCGVLEWSEAGRVNCVRRPSWPSRIGLGAAELNDVQEARLFLSGYKCLDREKQVRLNGELIGVTPTLTGFQSRAFIPVPPDKLGKLAVENEVVVENPRGERMLLGAFYLEARLRDGRLARSTVSQEAYATCGEWDDWRSPILRHVPPGQEIRVKGLMF
ncbi:MAG: metallophosphoesterase [Verrucomicrobiae bacterium]|nr:metallophosphoesterase [Verrucomicrobiae bacterium]